MNVTVKTREIAEDIGLFKIGVDLDWGGNLRISIGNRSYLITPESAVILWRCLMGERESCSVSVRKIGLVGISGTMSLKYQNESITWKVEALDVSFCIDADQAMALAWAIKACVARSLTGDAHGPAPVPEKERSYVWVIRTSCLRLFDGCICNGRNPLGGRVEVFSSRENAEGRLREFVRPLVNEVHSEDEDINVDRIIDRIIDNSHVMLYGEFPCDVYSYEANGEAFEVLLGCLPLDGHV